MTPTPRSFAPPPSFVERHKAHLPVEDRARLNAAFAEKERLLWQGSSDAWAKAVVAYAKLADELETYLLVQPQAVPVVHPNDESSKVCPNDTQRIGRKKRKDVKHASNAQRQAAYRARKTAAELPAEIAA